MNSQEQLNKLINHIEQVVVGKREVIKLVLIALLAEGHLLIEDVPGVGKTTLANTLASSIACSFTRIQFTPDTLPSDITGLSIYNLQSGQFEFVQGAIMSSIVLADEINRTSPKTQASLLEAMEERQITVDGKSYKLPKPFMVIATQNPIDYLGTYNLPEAQMDRFLMRISMGYPSSLDEKQMIKNFLGNKGRKKIDAVLDVASLCKMQEEVKEVAVSDDLIGYIYEVVYQTRQHEAIQLGVSPRGSLALIRAAQAKAYVSGRDYIIPDDIVAMIDPVLQHRLLLAPEATINRLTPEKILGQIVGKIKIPI
ncbi:magnesium chelatase [Sporanaerobium hydrogeniformans]|uniref:Magnesium chelatase n=1 Tax=Sporanaerobium hydrogeniformans TaxID=3072179 RepID=A0AC61DHK1_9FIRM|nr:MoxR family ATPase [Sporanaerobium hydrogeniformans]PHV72101.1 magnesium chelatase [Sporanaerobium hydrogeniformans]